MIHIHKWGKWVWKYPNCKQLQMKECKTCGKVKTRLTW